MALEPVAVSILIERNDLVDAAALLGAARRFVAVEDHSVARLDRGRRRQANARPADRFHHAERNATFLGIVAANQRPYGWCRPESHAKSRAKMRAAFPGRRAE